MSGAPGTLPAGEACIYCTAWRHWGTQGVSRGGGGGVVREATGQCRAHPPTINHREASTTNAEWPIVAARDWCRSYAPMGEAQGTEEAA